MIILVLVLLLALSVLFLVTGRRFLGYFIFLLGISAAVSLKFLSLSEEAVPQTDGNLVYLTSLSSPDGQYKLALFGGGALVGDPSWHVLKVAKDQDPSLLKIPNGYTNGFKEEERRWLRDTLLWNYEEACNRCAAHPALTVVCGRFLVFSRGGLNVGLYDLKTEAALVDEHSPWNMCGMLAASPGERFKFLDDAAVYSCMKKELDGRIQQILSESGCGR